MSCSSPCSPSRPSSPTKQQVTQLEIEKVFALSTPGRETVACCPGSAHVLAYAASCFAIVLDSSNQQQLHQLRSTTSNHTLQCVAWSCSGDHLAAGEAGSNPSVLIWDVSTGQCKHELKGHKHSIAALRFSPDGKLLASVGAAQDGQLCIWDWHSGALLCRQHVAAGLHSAAFTEDGSHVLVAGKGTFKSWSVSWSTQSSGRNSKCSSGGSSATDAPACFNLVPRQVSLREQRNSTFVDVCLAPSVPGQAAGTNGVYALTDRGVLLLMRPTGRTIDKTTNLQVREAFGLAATTKQVACACSQGIVRLFACKSLMIKATLPLCVRRDQEEAAAGGTLGCKVPDARGCSFGAGSDSDSHLAVVYSDGSTTLWDIHDLSQINRVMRLTAHSGCVWDVCPVNVQSVSSAGSPTRQQQQEQLVQCLTCGADGTIRIWNMAEPGIGKHATGCVSIGAIAAGIAADAGDAAGSSPRDLTGTRKVQLRCMRLNEDSTLLLLGDSAGNVHVFRTEDMQLLVVQEAHDGEVLCLDFSPSLTAGPASAGDSSVSKGGMGLAASGSQDMLIHVYDAKHGFRLLETLDEHEAAVTAVRFTSGGKGLISCGADRSIIFRVLGSSTGVCGAHGYKVSLKQTLPHSLLYDLVLDPLNSYVLTTGQDGLLRQWDLANGALKRTLKPEIGAGEVIRLSVDPGGVVAICCHSDGCLRLYELASGKLMWRAWGHASLVAAATISPDLRRLVSVGGDGCIIVWQLPDSLLAGMQEAAARVALVKKNMGCTSPSPVQQLQQQHAHMIAGSAVHDGSSPSPMPPAAPTCTPASTLKTPQQQQQDTGVTAGSGKKVTPGSSASDGAMSSSLQRVKQGKPLVSVDKLPRWARSPSLSSGGRSSSGSDAPTAAPAALTPGQQMQQRFGRWLSGKLASKGKWQPAAEMLMLHADAAQLRADAQDGSSSQRQSPCGGTPAAAGDSSTPGSMPDNKWCVFKQQQNPCLAAWGQDDGMVVVRHWQDGSSFSAAGPPAASAAAAAVLSVAADASGANNLNSPQQQRAEEKTPTPKSEAKHLQQQVVQATPADQGVAAPAGVVKDLFKQHFSNLAARCRLTPQPDMDEASLVVHQDRQSFSAMFKRGRGTVADTFSQLEEADDADAAAASAAVVAAWAGPQPLSPSAASLSPAKHPAIKPLNLQAVQSEAAEGRAAKRPGSHEPSPREKRWRQGQMDHVVAGMRERLDSLQALYQQQQQQQSRLSPRRAKTSDCPEQQQQQHEAQQQAQEVQQQEQEVQQQQQQQSPQMRLLLGQGFRTSPRSPKTAARRPPRPNSRPGSSTGSRQSAVSSPARSPPMSTSRCSWPDHPDASPPAAQAGGGLLGSMVFGSSHQPASVSSGETAIETAHTADAAAMCAAEAELEQDDFSQLPDGADAAQPAASPVPACGRNHLLMQLLEETSPVASTPTELEPTAAQASTGWVQPFAWSPDAVTGAAGTSAAAKTASPGAGPAANAGPQCLLQGLLAKDDNTDSENAAAASEGPSSPQATPAAAAEDWSSPRQLFGPQTTTRQLSGSLQQQPANDKISQSPDSPVPALQEQPGSPIQQASSPLGLHIRCAASPSTEFRVSECRVSIGTSIAARSPARTSSSVPSADDQDILQPTASDAAAAVTAAAGSKCCADLKLSTSCRGAAEDSGTTAHDSLDLSGVPGAAVVAAAPGEDGGSPRQQEGPDVVPALSHKTGVTITPGGSHAVWPGWGDGCWEATPSPDAAAAGMKAMWSAQSARVAEHRGGPSTSTAGGHSEACSSGYQSASSTAGGATSVGDNVGSSAGGASSTPDFWVEQNPCYDMTPIGSTPDSGGRHSGSRTHSKEQAHSHLQPPGAEVGRGARGSQDDTPHVKHRKKLAPDAVMSSSCPDAATATDTSTLSDALVGSGELCTPLPVGGLCDYPGTPPTTGGSSKAGHGSSRHSNRTGGSRHSSAAKSAGKTGVLAYEQHIDSQPGSASGMLGLLQRMKLTLPTIKTRPGSTSNGSTPRRHGDGSSSSRRQSPRTCWSPTATASAQPSEGSTQLDVQQQQPDRRQTILSPDEITLVMQPVAAAGDAHTDFAAGAPAGILPNSVSARNHTVAVEIIASVEKFKQSAQEMQQLWQRLLQLDLEPADAQELDQLLMQSTRATQTLMPFGAQGYGSIPLQAAPPRRAGEQHEQHVNSNSSALVLLAVQQRLQEQLLRSMYDLHATITGVPGVGISNQLQGAGPCGSPPCTPCAAEPSSRSPGQQMQSQPYSQSSSSYQTAAGGSSAGYKTGPAGSFNALPQSPAIIVGAGGPQALDDLTTRICDMLLQKLDERGTGLMGATQVHVRHESSNVEQQ